MDPPLHPDAASEIALVRDVVGRHALPPFVTGFEVRLGEFDGEPAMWVTFRTANPRRLKPDEMEHRGEELSDFTSVVRTELLAAIQTRFPFFRFADERSLAAHPA